MTGMKTKLVTLGAVSAFSLGTAFAVAQGLPPGFQPGQGQPGQPNRRGFPPNHPPMPGAPGQGQGRPGGGMIGPDGKPRFGPGTRPQRPGTAPTHAPKPAAEPEEEEHEEHECPGHGPDDAPPHVNYWHGIFMVNNEQAVKPGFVNQLLFRYEDPKNPCDPKNEPAPYLASLLNFGLLAFILFYFGRKPLENALLQRKKTITADIDTATKLKEDAEARLDDYEEKLDNIESKLAEVRAEYAAQADVENKHVLAEAEERRIRMRRDAEFRIEQERKAARDMLLHEAVVAATAAAEALIQKQLSASDHDRMANAYLASIGASLNKPRLEALGK